MKTLQILGPGCSRCKLLAERVEEAARELGLDCEIEKITDINVITGFGVMTTPALAIDGAVKFSGTVPTATRIKELIQ